MPLLAISRKGYHRSESQIEVVDGVITKATPSYRWAIGMKFGKFELDLLAKKEYFIDRLPKRTRPAKTLGVGKHVPVKPSTRELARRTDSSEVVD